MGSFDSGDDQRVQNNPAIEGYSGPDDVALSYRTLSDEDKQLMKEFKVACQFLINDVREHLGNCAPGTVTPTHPELERAITHIIDASANITRFITRFRTEYNAVLKHDDEIIKSLHQRDTLASSCYLSQLPQNGGDLLKEQNTKIEANGGSEEG